MYIYISLNRDIGQFSNVVSCKRNRMFMDAKWPHVHIHETGSCCMLSIYRLCTWKGMQTNQTLRLSKCSSCSVEWRTHFFFPNFRIQYNTILERHSPAQIARIPNGLCNKSIHFDLGCDGTDLPHLIMQECSNQN